MRGLLLDRDGVINVDHGYVGERSRFEFTPGIFDLVRGAVDRGFRVGVVTNQAGIARGYYSEADFLALTDWMLERFAAAGAPIAAVFHCPHHPEGVVEGLRCQSYWRKPAPGMVLEAITRLRLDPARTVMLGDQPTDMTAARRGGVAHRVRVAPPGTVDGDSTLVIEDPAQLAPYLHNL
jgi:D-glycero-D-manno-heptose 1,7-bisphosphate phosphatase